MTKVTDIPHFPSQAELKPAHIPIIRSAVNHQKIRSAEYSYYYLTSWYYNRPALISRINERLVFDVEGKQGGHIFLGPFGKGDIKSAVETLLKHAVEDFNEEPVLRFLPKNLSNEILKCMKPSKVEEHRDFFDYLYSREELAALKGRKFQKRRNQLNKIQRTYDPKVIKISQNDQKEVLDCISKWYENYGDDDPFLDMERESVCRALPGLFELGGVGVRIKIEGRFCGLSWAVPISDDTWLVPVEKAAREIQGMYQFVNWALANNLPESVKYLNREADLGIEGLRIAKQRYNPVDFETKTTLWF